MKKSTQLSRLFLILAVFLLGSMVTASAYDFMVDGIYYNVIGDNAVEVTRHDTEKYTGEVYIPATVTYEGITYQVTSIGQSAFLYGTLTLVDIPEGITEIHASAFAYCTNLGNVDLPNSLLRLGVNAFYFCSKLTEVYIPRNVAEIGDACYGGCPNIAYYMCSSMNTHYQVVDGALYTKDMTKLLAYPPKSPAMSFEIPNTVTRIHSCAVNYADNLTEVTIPESVTWVGSGVFYGCDGLESLVFPDGVTHIGPSACSGCDNLTYLHLPASLDTLCNSTVGYLPKLTELTIPRNVKYIDDFAFVSSRGLVTVNFEEGSCLEKIGSRAFDSCTNLETCLFPNSMTTMAAGVFNECSSIKNVHISDNLVNLGSSIFWKCPALTECILPGGVLNVKNVCVNCNSLRYLRIGDRDSAPGVTVIENCGVSSCPELLRIDLGVNVDSLTQGAFVGVDNLKVVISWSTAPPRCDPKWSVFSPHPEDLDAVLYVPKASLEAYSTAANWMNFNTIAAIEDLGDVDGNGTIDISDVTVLIDELLEGGEINRAAYADVDLDGSISISDVTTLIDILLGNK